jgi:glutamate-1-semialdehyde 2,1-aminomutase
VNRKRSEEFQKRAEKVIAHSALTNSKRPESFIKGVYPTHLEWGIDSRVYDVDRNCYVDYICGLGSQLFGYRNYPITVAVNRQISAVGTIFSLGSKLEVEVAELFCNQFSYIHQLRFLKTASEACSAAVRIARSFTGKQHIYSNAYHGWHDEFTSLTPPANGVPEHAFIHALRDGEIPSDAAAVIIEPVITDLSQPRINYLRTLSAECKNRGIVVIWDETITGLRFPDLSVAKHTGIDPDLTIMGKAIGGGYPLALVGGRRDIMSCEYFVSSTFAGDCVALAAAKAVFGIINTAGFQETLHGKANSFCTQFNSIAPHLLKIEGYGTRGVFKGNEVTLALFMQECVKAGVLFGPSFFYGTSHHTQDDFTLGVCRAVLNRIDNKEVKLEGEMPKKPYAQKVRDDSAR